jgi:hypothetical protein
MKRKVFGNIDAQETVLCQNRRGIKNQNSSEKQP